MPIVRLDDQGTHHALNSGFDWKMMRGMRLPGTDGRQLKLLGIEGGGTKTLALFVHGDRVEQREAGPSNLQLLTDGQLEARFRTLARNFPMPDAIGIGLAGARTQNDVARIRSIANRVWRGVPCVATSDLETGLAVAPLFSPRQEAERPVARVLVLSGTGSCCFGKSLDGRTVRVGGWGHVIGDRGSGYAIGLQGIKTAVETLDRTGRWPKLGARILSFLLLNNPEELVPWAQSATKDQIAALAVHVFEGARNRERLCKKIISNAAQDLVEDALTCARQLAPPPKPVEFVLAGGVLIKQKGFARLVASRIIARRAGAIVTTLRKESVWGAVELARRLLENCKKESSVILEQSAKHGHKDASMPAYIVASKDASPTEARNPRSSNLDKMPVSQAIRLMLSEESKVTTALWQERKNLEKAIALIVRALRNNGRLFYVGAGTSGRLGVLDASECPPTFSTPPEQVQAIIAGGCQALWQSVEGAEDNYEAGASAIKWRLVKSSDVVVGIAASGRTPFVWGALKEARSRGAKNVLLCCNPKLKIPKKDKPDVVIALDTGPEVLTGSTRLKAGTATKLALNMFSTLSMVKLGKVISNLMVDVRPANAKLRARAVRIVKELTGANEQLARSALEKARWNIRKALHLIKPTKAVKRQ